MSAARKPAIVLIAATKKHWPKYESIQAMPMETRRLLGDYLGLISHDSKAGTDEGLFGAANILHRAGLSFEDLGRYVFDEAEEARVAA